MNKIFASIIVLFILGCCYAEDYDVYPIDITGKVLNEDGSLFLQKVEIKIWRTIVGMDEEGLYANHPTDVISTDTGTFSHSTTSNGHVTISANKEGFRSTEVGISDNEDRYDAKDILIYMIPKGASSRLISTEYAYIPKPTDKESQGKLCGWSFNDRWYYPVDEREVDMSIGLTEKGNRIYKMKAPGGFIMHKGFRQFENKEEYIVDEIEYLTEAPENGYITEIVPAKYPATERGYRYAYFKTPDGLYGKIAFHGQVFDYYIQPDRLRNLELGDEISRPAIPPEAR